ADHLVDERVALRDQGGDRGGNEGGEQPSPETELEPRSSESHAVAPQRRELHGALRDGACQERDDGAVDTDEGRKGDDPDDLDDVEHRRQPGSRGEVAEGVERAEGYRREPVE